MTWHIEEDLDNIHKLAFECVKKQLFLKVPMTITKSFKFEDFGIRELFPQETSFP